MGLFLAIALVIVTCSIARNEIQEARNHKDRIEEKNQQGKK
jgi:hypothetical protein